ncbi:MAG: NADH-quinone oxidoreductase subunit K [Deltaproteobacteria bacterium RBG_13_49_15]|nr:MAG: NADH-quinone oxidoreductase subunit K [Deltaproteobacteria bacterium RBG_13_49_15]
MSVGLSHFLTIGAVVFSLGLFCVITRRNAIGVLMGVELILNSANINFLAFSHFSSGTIDGHLFALFCIVLAALECAVALAIVLAVFRNFDKVIDMEQLTTLHK